MALACSPLGIQCQVLSIQIHNRQCILCLVHHMINLRFLTIICEELMYSNRLKTETDGRSRKENVVPEKELIQWLKERLPSTYMIDKHSLYSNRIQIWM
jgi:hypothetical protein